MRRIFQFDETSLNSSSSDTYSRTASQSTTTINDYSLKSSSSDPYSRTASQSTNFSSGQASGSQDAYASGQASGTQHAYASGIFEDHPGLNPTDERVVELQCMIRENFEVLTCDPQRALNLAEASHGESNNIPFLEYLLDDLTQNGVSGESFREALDQVGQAAASPLDQFEIVPLIPMNIGNFYFSFTNPSLFMLLTLSFFLLLIHFITKKGGGNLVPNAWQSLVELLYDFVLNLVKEQIGGLSGNVKQMFFPCILVTFLFLLFCNLQGMIPYSFTVTSHFLITLALSFSIFIGITIVGFQRHGLHFFSFLLPAGVPLPLAPFLVLLELISYCFRALSLGIRLFANMMAGHSLVKILSGFAWTMLCMNEIFYFIGALGPLFIVLALTGLELGVAILQAYVFTILICIYLNDAINLH